MPLVKHGAFVVVLWQVMLLTYPAQEIRSQRVASLILHNKKYNPEDLQCLYQEKRNDVCNVGEKIRNDRW